MRTLFFILYFATTVVGQGLHNDKIVEFVEKNIGKKVMNGVCYELFEGALRTYDSVTHVDSVTLWTVYSRKDVIPGDLIFIDGINDGVPFSHIAIVYKIEGKKMFIAHQNIGVDDLEDSIVIVEEFVLSDYKRDYKNLVVEYIRVK